MSDGTVLQCVKTDPKYYLGWMKVRDQKSHTYPDAPCFKENGVWIDLYKLVKAKACDVPALIAQEAITYLDRRLAAGGLSKEEYDKRVQDGKLIEKLNEAKANRNISDDRNVYIIWSASKIILEEEWVEPLQYVNFEDLSVTTFSKAEEYLIRHYGDSFMEYPPDEMRRVGISKIEW